MNVIIVIHILQQCTGGFQKSASFFKGGECEKTGGEAKEERVDGGLAGCFHSCHGDELASYD